MKFVSPNQAVSTQNSPQCYVQEYPLDDKKLNGAIITVKGRYPEHGRVVNKKCKELVFILSGDGRVEVEEKAYSFAAGDMMIIDPKEKYFWEGEFTMLAVCTPPFDPEQHEAVM